MVNVQVLQATTIRALYRKNELFEGKDELFMVRWEAGDTTWESLQNLEDTACEKVAEYRARQAGKA